MSKVQNLITLKFKYKCNADLVPVLKQYNSLLRYTYNRVFDNPSISFHELNSLQKGLNGCNLMNAWLRTSAEYASRAWVKLNCSQRAVFGGKALFKKRCQHKISHEEFELQRLVPLSSIGESNANGNRLFKLLDRSTVEFVVGSRSNKQHFQLRLLDVGDNRAQLLDKVIQLQNNCKCPITYYLDLSFICITFDFNQIQHSEYNTKEYRVMAIDMNPNSLGVTIVDWIAENRYKLVAGFTFSFKSLNQYQCNLHVNSSHPKSIYATNKRKYELTKLASKLTELCKYYHCQIFAAEDLNIQTSDRGKGKKYNKLVNNMWDRNYFLNQLKKRICSSITEFNLVPPQWGSYIGNILFRELHLPDECLASIEIGRRGFEFCSQFIFMTRPCKKVIIYPDLQLFKSQLFISLEEIGIDADNLDDWIDILLKVKKSKSEYRFSTFEALKFHSKGLFSKFYKRQYLNFVRYC